MADITSLGKLIDENEKRDAIHIAVAPVVASERLAPGQPIAFMEDGDTENVRASERPIGIVDPFLTSLVFEGQRFWMFLYPGTITSLRHDWTHPAFAEAEHSLKPSTKASEEWLREFCEHNGPDFDLLIAAAASSDGYAGEPDGYHYARIEHDYLTVGGTDAHGEIPSEFWDRLEAVTGKKLRNRPTRFSCSC
jgi:hypothetical protein